MKKYYFLIIVTLILGLALTGCFLSNVGQVPTTEQSGISYLTKHTEGDPFTTDLIAGGGNPASAIDVGDVLVWNDEINLYVKYVITDPDWCLTETHLHVFLDNDEYTDITLKNGNPPPGQFDYKEEHECVPDYTYEIPLIWVPETPLFIAAHAVVQKLSEVTVTLTSGTQTLSAGYTEIEPVNPLVPTSYSGSSTWFPAVPVSDPPIPPWIVLPGAVWVSSAATTEGGFGDQWRLFKEDFTIPSGAVNIAGLLYMTADNAVEAYLNGFSVGSTTYVFGSKPDPIVNPTHYYFQSPWGPFNLALQADSNNTLAFVVRNWGHSDYNPTGLIYKLDYEYQLLEEETAWAAGSDFPGKNWATYFTYTVQQHPLVGNWLLSVNSGAYLHDMFIFTVSPTGDISGEGGYPSSGPPYNSGYDWTLTGSISGNAVTMTLTYTNGYTATITGTVASDWNSMSGGVGTGGVINWIATREP